jgi:peptidyl-prolyl cis-trans isomerase C
MKMKKVLLVSACCVAALLMGCSDSGSIATVNGKDITQEEFNAYLKFKRIPEQDKDRVARAKDEYINRAAIAAAIEETEKLDAALVEAELEEFRRQMLIGRYFEEHLNTAVDDDAVRNYYSGNQSQYESQRVHAAHILIRVDANMSETERQAKLSSAHEAYSRVQKGDDFAEVAKAHSEDKVSAEKGGDLGWLVDGAVDAEFSKKLFSMKPGEVSEPFLTPFGFHVVKMLEGPQLIKRPLESVEGDIRYQLRNQAKVTETERLMETINVKREE